ncbi:MAG TPA: carbohydrate binding domain-containing protein, partial [Polyangiaceae bacterium]|nr:carbohydrate binding domain-containing protein [Polyangiaceae bacterium]
QDETDVDCGGVCSSTVACAIGKRCKTALDCDSYVCTAGKCSADLVIPSADVIEDFEDGDLLLPANPARGGRVGNWYAFNDSTGTETLDVLAIRRGSASVNGLHVRSKDFTSWGSGVGVDFDNSATKAAYDASAYGAITFWGRAVSPMPVKVMLPDVDTDTAGNTCSACSHHYFTTVSMTTTWQRFTVAFSDLTLEAGGVPAPSAFKPSGLLSLHFQFAAGGNSEVFIDDVALIKK